MNIETKTTTTTILFAPFCTKKKLQIELNEYLSDWAPEITMGANLVGCPLYKVLIYVKQTIRDTWRKNNNTGNLYTVTYTQRIALIK